MIREALLGFPEPRMNLRVTVALLLVVIVVSSSYQTPASAQPSSRGQSASTLADPTQTVNVGAFSTENGCTYLIFTDRTTTYVQDCNTGMRVSSGADAATQINDAIATLKSGGLIHVRAGTYMLTTPVVGAVNGVTFEGEGANTLFKVNIGFSESVIVVRGSNWVLRNFKIDATNQLRQHNTAGIYVAGNNETIAGTDISETDHAGIDGVHFGCEGNCGYGIKILHNVITNGYDDGIIVRGSNVLVSGNVVDTTTNHNGISLVSPQNVSVVGNSINNTNNGIALENLGYGWGPAKFITLTGNIIRNSRFIGFWIFSGDGDSGDYITFSGNSIINPLRGGIELDSGMHIMIANNLVADSSGNGIYVLWARAQFVTITDNTVISSKGYGISMNSSDGLIDNNTITDSKGSAILIAGNNITVRSNHVRALGSNRIGIASIGVSGFTITDNTITGSGTPGISQFAAGIIAVNSTSGLVSSNVIIGDASSGILLENESRTEVVDNSVNVATNCILETTSDYNIISNNILSNCDTALSYIGSHDVATNDTDINHGAIQSPMMLTQTMPATSGLRTQELMGSVIVIAAAVCVAFLTKIRHRPLTETTQRRRTAPRVKARENR